MRLGSTYTPAGHLATWMRALGWGGQPLSGEQCAAWIATWEAEQAQERVARLRSWERGPGVARPGLPDQYRIGRQLFRKTAPMRGVRDPDGVWHDISEHRAVDDILGRVDSRFGALRQHFLPLTNRYCVPISSTGAFSSQIRQHRPGTALRVLYSSPGAVHLELMGSPTKSTTTGSGTSPPSWGKRYMPRRGVPRSYHSSWASPLTFWCGSSNFLVLTLRQA